MEKRRLGRTGEELSVIGFGGIIVMDETPRDAASFVEEAVAAGVNYFDVAPSYGNAEERLGPALEPYRDGIFLACKSQRRTAREASAELAQSLRNLKTDRIDLYQLHAVSSLSEVEEIFSPGGAMEAFIEARKQGTVRYLGFSAHSEQAALELIDRYPFDTVLFPINRVMWYRKGFGKALVEKASSAGMGILALKALAERKLEEFENRSWKKAWYHPVETYEEALAGIRFTLGKPVTAAVSPGHIELFRWACRAAGEYTPLTREEEEALIRNASGLKPLFP